MNDLTSLIREDIAVISNFLITSQNILCLILDPNDQVIAANPYFERALCDDRKLDPSAIDKFLIEDGKTVFQEMCRNGQSTILHFKPRNKPLFPMKCQCIHIQKNNRLIIGIPHVISEGDIIQKMTVMSNEMVNMTRELQKKNRALEEAKSKIKTLSGIIPICMHCKGIRNDKGYWDQVEDYISEHSDAQFSHGICEGCMKKFYADTD